MCFFFSNIWLHFEMFYSKRCGFRHRDCIQVHHTLKFPQIQLQTKQRQQAQSEYKDWLFSYNYNITKKRTVDEKSSQKYIKEQPNSFSQLNTLFFPAYFALVWKTFRSRTITVHVDERRVMHFIYRQQKREENQREESEFIYSFFSITVLKVCLLSDKLFLFSNPSLRHLFTFSLGWAHHHAMLAEQMDYNQPHDLIK